jgi:hypothetical protein
LNSGALGEQTIAGGSGLRRFPEIDELRLLHWAWDGQSGDEGIALQDLFVVARAELPRVAKYRNF